MAKKLAELPTRVALGLFPNGMYGAWLTQDGYGTIDLGECSEDLEEVHKTAVDHLKRLLFNLQTIPLEDLASGKTCRSHIGEIEEI